MMMMMMMIYIYIYIYFFKKYKKQSNFKKLLLCDVSYIELFTRKIYIFILNFLS